MSSCDGGDEEEDEEEDLDPERLAAGGVALIDQQLLQRSSGRWERGRGWQQEAQPLAPPFLWRNSRRMDKARGREWRKEAKPLDPPLRGIGGGGGEGGGGGGYDESNSELNTTHKANSVLLLKRNTPELHNSKPLYVKFES